MSTPVLDGQIAVVTGASRGIGRGVAHELGLAGATVYVTGRTRDGAPPPDGLPGTIDDTARLVTASGGRGIAVACDHTRDDDVDALAARIGAEHGRVDLLVHAAWGGYERYDASLFTRPPAEQPRWRWDTMFATGVRAQYVTSHALLPLLLASRRALIVHVSAGDDGKFLGDVQYDVAKAAVDRLGLALARRLRDTSVVALTVHPGLTHTERVEAHSTPQDRRGAHSARFVGRTVIALATDPALASRAGGVFKTGQLGLDYDLRDVDGSQPAPFVL